jgi:hypothetical protein
VGEPRLVQPDRGDGSEMERVIDWRCPKDDDHTSITVCRSPPRSSATSATMRPCRPTYTDQRAGRVVIPAARGDLRIGSVRDRGHAAHCQRWLRHTNWTGRPNTGGSAITAGVSVHRV